MADKNISFSESLLQKGLISREQLDKALAVQNKGRLLGSIAVELGLLAQEDVLKVQEYQEAHDVPFGEAAVSLGFITTSQLKFLLDIRLRKKIRIGDILVQEGFIEKEKLYDELMRFEKRRHRLEKILVCDSSEIVNSLLKKRLERYGYRVFFAESPSSALETAYRETPNLVIAGEIFSGLPELVSWTRNFSLPKFTETRIIFMAQDIDENLIEKSFEVGIHHFLKKPVMEYELLNVIYSIEQETRKKREEKILVVEDSDMVRQIMVRELKRHGYTVFQAGSGEEALRIAREEKPTLITMDILMPGIDGYETCRRLKNDPAARDIPVVMVSSCKGMEEREKGFEAGAVEYFIKPFAPDQLADFINLLFETKKTRRKEKAVVIEDNKTTLHIVKHILEKQGIEAITAENGLEGLEKIRQFQPDIILADIYMPVMDGFELLLRIKKSPETRDIPCILMTGSKEKGDVLKGLAHGASDFVVKPFDESELLARVTNLLANKKLFDELKSERENTLRQSNILEAINSVFHRALTCETDEDVARACLDVAAKLTGSLFGFIGEINRDGRFDTIAQSDLGWEACKIPKSDAIRMIRNMEVRGLWGAVIKSESPSIVNCPASCPDRVGTPEGHPPIARFLGVPLKKGGKVTGLIGLANKETDYLMADRQAVEMLSSAFVEALARKRTEMELEKHRRSLEEMVEQRTAELTGANMDLSFEILERKKAEEKLLASISEKELLTREINHRVKNNLHIISGLLALQSEYIEEPKTMHVFQGCRNRIEMMAFIHEKLYKSESPTRIDFNEFIKHLAYYLSGAYIRSRKNIRLAIEAEGVFLGIDTAIPCGLVINELVSNAMRHAFPGNRDGEVRIAMRGISDFGMRNADFQAEPETSNPQLVTHDPEPATIELIVSDNGTGLPADLDVRKTRSFGLHLAVNLAEKQLHGSVELSREKGTEFRIRFRERKYASRMGTA